MLELKNPSTNGGNGGLISHVAGKLEEELSDKLNHKGLELEKLLKEKYHEGCHTALEMAKLCAVAKLAAKTIAAFGWDTEPDAPVNGSTGGGDQLLNLFHDLLTDERNSNCVPCQVDLIKPAASRCCSLASH